MCPRESAGRSAGQGPDDLASALLARIAGGDLPGGAELDPVRLAPLYGVRDVDIADALPLLAAHGAATFDGMRWRVADRRSGEDAGGPGGSGREPDLLHWLVPVLRAIVTLAAARVTPAEAAGILAAYDRYAGLAGDGTAAGRTEGYRQMMERLAAASGSRFHAGSLAGLLDQADRPLRRMVARRMQSRRTAEPDDELGRLAQAMMQGQAADASAALEDHLILLGRYFDNRGPIRR